MLRRILSSQSFPAEGAFLTDSLLHFFPGIQKKGDERLDELNVIGSCRCSMVSIECNFTIVGADDTLGRA